MKKSIITLLGAVGMIAVLIMRVTVGDTIQENNFSLIPMMLITGIFIFMIVDGWLLKDNGGKNKK